MKPRHPSMRHICMSPEAKLEFENLLRPSFPSESRPLAHPQRFITQRIVIITSFHLKDNHIGSLSSLLKAASIHIWVYRIMDVKIGQCQVPASWSGMNLHKCICSRALSYPVSPFLVVRIPSLQHMSLSGWQPLFLRITLLPSSFVYFSTVCSAYRTISDTYTSCCETRQKSNLKRRIPSL